MPKVPVPSWTRCSSTSRYGPMLPTTMRQSFSDLSDASLRLDDPHGLAVEPSSDVIDDVRKVFPVVLLAHIAEMRRDDDIVHLTERMIERQRLDIENVKPGAGNGFRLKRCDQ